MPYFVAIFKKILKSIFIIEISTLKSVLLPSLAQKWKCLKLGPKMPDLGIFGQEFENNFVIFETSTF